MKLYEQQKELIEAEKNGAFPEKLLKDILEEAYLAQVEQQWEKAVYFYRMVYQADEKLTGDEHARFA